MSYNVSGFTIKKLDSFTLPYADVLEMAKGHVTVRDEVLDFTGFYATEMEIIGTRDGASLRVTNLHYSGGGSGTYWRDFEELLTKSTGTLRARVVWEGGHTVEIVAVTDGTVKRETVKREDV